MDAFSLAHIVSVRRSAWSRTNISDLPMPADLTNVTTPTNYSGHAAIGPSLSMPHATCSKDTQSHIDVVPGSSEPTPTAATACTIQAPIPLSPDSARQLAAANAVNDEAFEYAFAWNQYMIENLTDDEFKVLWSGLNGLIRSTCFTGTITSL